MLVFNYTQAYEFYLFLCLLARRCRISAFFFADPEPCSPVMYVFFFAFVFTFVSVGAFFNLVPLKVMPDIIACVISSSDALRVTSIYQVM